MRPTLSKGLSIFLAAMFIAALAFGLAPVGAVDAATNSRVAQLPAGSPIYTQTVRVWMNSDTIVGETAGVEVHNITAGTWTKYLGSYDNTSYPGANWYVDLPALAVGTQVEYQLFVRATDNVDYGFSGFNWNYTVQNLPNTVYVNWAWAGIAPGADPDDVGPATNFGGDAFATIQNAIAGVAAGGTIHIAGGTYVETLTVSNKQISFIGATDGSGAPLPTIQGSLSIDLPGTDDNWSVQNINFTPDTATAALLVLKNVHNVAVTNCTFDGAGRFMQTPSVVGVNLVSGPNGNDHVTIANSEFKNGLYVAIQGYVNYLTVSEATIENVKSGINHIGGGGNLVVENSSISVVAQAAGSDTYGIRFANTAATENMSVTGATITVDKNGLIADPGTYHSAIILRTAATGVLEVENSSINGEVVNLSTTTLNASGNWWGTAVPAEVKTLANGGSLVDYTPWLNSGTDTIITASGAGFQGDFSYLNVDDDSPQTGVVGRIQEAIDLVSGSTVNVAAGLYDERINITKKLTLLGATAGESKKDYVPPAGYAYDPAVETIIQPTADLDVSVVRIGADEVVVDGIVVANTGILTAGNMKNLVEFTHTVAFPVGSQLINSVVGPLTGPAQDGTLGRFGVVAPGPSATSGSKTRILTISDNYIYDCLGNGGGVAIIGAMDTGDELNAGTQIVNNTITGHHRSGIEIAGEISGTEATPVLIANNTITDNGAYADTDAANLKYGNGISFIRIGSDRTNGEPYGLPSHVLILNNLIEGNEKNGIYMGPLAENITIAGNTVQNNGALGAPYLAWDGIQIDLTELYYGANPAITSVLQNIVVTGNNILGNGGLGVNVIGGEPDNGPINAAQNWWGIATSAGVAAQVSPYVNYCPWLDALAPGGVAINPDGNIVTNVDTGELFCSIQAAIDDADTLDGHTISAPAGVYVENIMVTKALTLEGSNAAVNPNTGVRSAEAVILPTFSDPDPTSATSSAIIYIAVDDVTIRGFTVDGDNPNLTSGVLVGTADVDAIEGIASYEGVGQIVIENNILQNYTYAALDFYNYTDASATTDNYIRYNRLFNISSAAGYGIGVLIYNNFYADITDNVMTAVRVGVQTGNYYQANPGTTASISNNNIETTRRGIFHNLAYSNASPFTISGNTFTVLDAPTGTKWDAIMLSSLQGSVNATVTGNIITGTDVTQLTAGYQIWNTPTTALLTISGGSVSGTDYGVWVNNFDGYNSDADNTAIILSGVQISDITLAGVYILDNPSEVHGHTVKATLLDGVVINDCTTGIWVSGPQASVNSYGNLIQNNATGALFESDAAGMLANNSLTGNSTAITNTGATLVNASSNWFGTADATAVAGLISDVVDYTPWLNSGTDTGAAAGFQGDFTYLNVDDDSPQAGSVGRIQEGVNLVSGSTVNVLPGIYAENVLVDKYVVITGAGSGDTADDTIVTSPAPATVDYKVGVFQIAASGLSAAEPIVLQNMRVQPNGQAGVSIGRFTEATGVTVDYLTLNNLWVIGTNNNAQTEQERGLYVDLTSTLNHLTVTDSAFNNLAYGWYIQKQVSADASTVSNVVVTNTVFNHNNLKGLYAEKLTDATFTDCTIDQNGFDATGLPSYFIPWMSGVDINLKAGTYQNIAFINATVTNNGLGGAKEGVGLAIKARTDGATYSPYPATLDNVLIANSTITGNERGIRIGEPGKNNPGPTNVVIHHNRIFGNVQTYSGTDGTTYGGVVNQSAADVTAENNWFGCNEGPNMAGCDATAAASTGLLDADPWLVLSAAADPTAVQPLGTSTIAADMIFNSDAADTSAAGYLPDGIPAAYTAPDGGTLSETAALTLNGTLLPTTTFTAPAADQAYQVCTAVDNELLCVDVTVQNVAPVAVDDTATTTEDTPVAILAVDLATNDTDANLDALTVTAVSNPTNGTVVLAAGTITFTPTADFNGTAGFDYTVSDGVLTDTGHVTVTVTAVNDAPVAVDNAYEMDEDTILNIEAPGVLNNDTDADGDTLTAMLVVGPTNGTLVLNADGSFTYTPSPNFFGTDAFTYVANDGTSDSNVATVTLTVVDMPETKYIYLPIILK